MYMGALAPWRTEMKENITRPFRTNWLFEVEPYSRTQTQTLADVRDDLRLKKLLKRAVESEMAPLSLIEAIRTGIRA